MPSDTPATALNIQARIFRGMSTAERLRVALEMSESLRQVALAGLRHRHPELKGDALSRETVRIMHGFVPRP
jgi:hypothetical protein